MNSTPHSYQFKVEDCHDVVPLLDEVIQHCKSTFNPLGYFAALYRLTTVRIVQGIDRGEFEDNERMARMDVIFANRFFDAMARIFNGEPTTQAWAAAARAAQDPDITTLQHLFLGMNAHINLDLSVAAAHTCPGDLIYDFENDFNTINAVLGSLVDTVQEDLVAIWHPLKHLLKLSGPFADLLTYFGLHMERKHAWSKAVILAQETGESYEESFHQIDSDATRVAERMIRPAWVLRGLIRDVRKEERGNVAYRIEEFQASSRDLKIS